MRLSRKDIENIGNRVCRAYRRLPSLSGQTIERIEPERLAREVCGLSIDYCHLSKNQQILGMTSYGEVGVEVFDDEHGMYYYCLDGKTILIESNLAQDNGQVGRYHFTVMHETSHQIIKMLYPREYSDVCHRIHYSLACRHQSGAMDWEEWQADALASVLLLPADLVIETAISHGLGHGIDILNRIYRPREYEVFCAMAEQLGASKQALAIRMKRLGLLNKDYLKDPYALVEIMKEDDEP